jgi:hypothetical protein
MCQCVKCKQGDSSKNLLYLVAAKVETTKKNANNKTKKGYFSIIFLMKLPIRRMKLVDGHEDSIFVGLSSCLSQEILSSSNLFFSSFFVFRQRFCFI